MIDELDGATLSFVESIHRVHLENAKTVYTASPGNRSTSPLTNFVFETFLFNSLYSVDWISTCEQRRLIRFDIGKGGPGESKKQREFVKFCRKNISEAGLNLAFRPLASLGDLSGAWTDVTEDDRISSEMGRSFFGEVEQFANGASVQELRPSKKYFDPIDSCLYFIYLVRNNIFHGQKKLGEIYDRDQMKRLKVYDLFLRCINSLFFIALGKSDFGSAYAQFPIKIGGEHETLEMPAEKLVGLAARRRFGIKQEDSWLFQAIQRESKSAAPIEGDSLFYPSAGSDFIFPVLAGLQSCTDFHFFEIGTQPDSMKIKSSLRAVGFGSAEKIESSNSLKVYEFEFDKIRRRLFFHKRNNLAFESLDVSLRFFFRRGDSPGEGGSGQLLDQDLLPQLLRTKASANGVFVLTDGEPGGLPESIASKLTQFYPPNSHRDREYFVGEMPPELFMLKEA
jgi:hypothetical protein